MWTEQKIKQWLRDVDWKLRWFPKKRTLPTFKDYLLEAVDIIEQLQNVKKCQCGKEKS